MVAVKICGLTTPQAVTAAIWGGARYLGFVFYEPSPRNVTPIEAKRLIEGVPDDITIVALTVDADDRKLAEIVSILKPSLLQLHGGETPLRVSQVRARYHRPVLKAVAISGRGDLATAKRYEVAADLLLFDARPPKGALLPGGNGIAFDWRLLTKQTWRKPWMLSGGLTAGNIAEAVRLTKATIVDVSSGVEDKPGVKSPEKVANFLAVANPL
ncbi:MAG: phosphoribosylanthranilate isomerase [Proteobacteria bacterium]|nr:phosphoribosylanthranilate isomerase [Pseudomonadota bacterium]MBI3498529.1 phosphoribosylanthranilate isomerase [Pseudomonadota bacterium]